MADLWSSRYSLCLAKSEFKKQNGLEDILFQLLIITPTYGKWTLGFGSQIIFPSATPTDIGTGKYQALPTFGIKYDLISWMKGAWTALLIRQAFSFAGQSNRTSISIRIRLSSYKLLIFNIFRI